MAAVTQCTPCCTTPQVTNIPGPVGSTGTNGTNGQSAYTITTAQFNVPGDTVTPVTVAVLSSLWMVVGQTLIIGQGSGAALANPGPATFVVTAIPSSTSVTVTWLNVPGDVAAGTAISVGAVVSPSAQPHASIKKTVISTPGANTFTPQANTKSMWVECIGGGGSGGGCDGGANASAASGGGGGGYSAKFLTTIKASYSCNVGAGGVAPAAGANPGNAGGDTTFDSPSVCTAKGGGAGGAGAAAGTAVGFVIGGSGGSSTLGIGDLKFGGGSGRSAHRQSGTVALAGGGGSGPFGGSGAPDSVTAGNGSNGVNFGGAGGGALSTGGSATAAGGAGAGGCIIVTEYS